MLFAPLSHLSYVTSSALFSHSSSFQRPFRFLFSIFTLGSSGRHGSERELKSEQRRDDTTTNGGATEVRKVTARVDVCFVFIVRVLF